MSSIALPALSIRPPAQPTDPLEQFSRLQAIRDMMLRQQLAPGQQQLQQEQIQSAAQENQLRQIQLQDQNGLHQAMIDSKGDPDALLKAIADPKYGISPNGQFGTIKMFNEYKQSQIALAEADRKNNIDSDSAIADRYNKISQMPSDQQASAINDLKADAGFLKGLTPRGQQEIGAFQYNGPDSVALMAHSHMTRQALDEQADKEASAAKNIAQTKEAEATTAKVQAETANLKEGGNQALADAHYRNIQMAMAQGKPIAPEDKAFVSAYEKQKTLVPQFNLNLQGKLLSPAAKDMAAENYFYTGQLPSGMRSPAMSAAIISRAAELHPNGTGDLAGNRAAYEANKKSYDNVTGTLDTLSAFEQSGLKNLKQFAELASKLPDTGVPWLNTPVRNLNKNLVGAEYMPAIEAARSVALREIARVTNDPKLSGALTDTARQEVSSFSPANATLPQIKRVVEVLTNDMANVHSSLAAQKADIGARLGIKAESTQAGGAQNQAKVPGPGTAKFHYAGKNGEIFSDDGKTWYDAKGQPIGK